MAEVIPSSVLIKLEPGRMPCNPTHMAVPKVDPMPRRRVQLLLDALARVTETCILTHTNSDPDAIASAVALRTLIAERSEVQCRLIYNGIIGRAESKAFVRYLCLPFQRPPLKLALSEPSRAPANAFCGISASTLIRMTADPCWVDSREVLVNPCTHF